MNSRERFLAVMSFQPIDRVPFPTLFQRFESETLRRWQRQGYPRDTHPARYFAFDRVECAPISLSPIPPFERAELDNASEWHLGADRENAAELESRFTVIEEQYPLNDRTEWPSLRRLLNPSAPVRFPRFWTDYVETTKDREYPLGLVVPGPFTSLRDWLGAPNLRQTWTADRAWIEEIAEHLYGFVSEILERADELSLDFILVEEQAAYLADSTIGIPTYDRLFGSFFAMLDDFTRGGVVVSSVGNVAELIPIWLDSGVRAVSFLEVSAGLDARTLRSEYPRSLVLVGNLDRHALAAGKRATSAEVNDKVPPLLEKGGYFPAPDGPVHAEVDFATYEYFLSLFQR